MIEYWNIRFELELHRTRIILGNVAIGKYDKVQDHRYTEDKVNAHKTVNGNLINCSLCELP
jgi:hypothetical protein